jgi:hypothetical protein
VDLLLSEELENKARAKGMIISFDVPGAISKREAYL